MVDLLLLELLSDEAGADEEEDWLEVSSVFEDDEDDPLDEEEVLEEEVEFPLDCESVEPEDEEEDEAPFANLPTPQGIADPSGWVGLGAATTAPESEAMVKRVVQAGWAPFLSVNW